MGEEKLWRWGEFTDKELAEEAQLGLRGQGAVVEMMSHLRDAITELNDTTTRQQTIMIWLTVAIAVLTVVMAVAAIAALVLR